MTGISDLLSHEKNREYRERRSTAKAERIIQLCFSITAQTKLISIKKEGNLVAYLSQESLEGSNTGIKECATWKNLY